MWVGHEWSNECGSAFISCLMSGLTNVPVHLWQLVLTICGMYGRLFEEAYFKCDRFE